jgi:hypothetical protein
MTDLEPSQPQPLETPAPINLEVPLSKKGKFIRFIIGFVGFFLLNGIGLFVAYGIPIMLGGNGDFPLALNIFLMVVPYLFLLVNLGLIIALFVPKKNRWVGIGFLSAIAFALLLVVVAGIFLTIVCFTAYR